MVVVFVSYWGRKGKQQQQQRILLQIFVEKNKKAFDLKRVATYGPAQLRLEHTNGAAGWKLLNVSW